MKKKLLLFYRYEVNVLKSMHIAFVGDSRIRDIFSYLKSLISGEPFDRRAVHRNLEYQSGHPRNILLVKPMNYLFLQINDRAIL
jgi:hypothetical protein